MKRPIIEDFCNEYGETTLIEMSQFALAQKDYIDYLLSQDKRDQFAGQALNGFLSRVNTHTPYFLAKKSYKIANAMMEARKGGDESFG